MVRDRILLFLKGMCMGIADVIPGVSGGTLALVLGIYREFVDTLRGLHLRWVSPLWRYLRGGRQPEDRERLVRELSTLNLPFLITLGAGIVTAVLIGSTFIPYLLEHHPAPTRAFFFGLIVASVWVPVRMIRAVGPSRGEVVGAMALAVGAAIFGFWVTAPGGGAQVATKVSVVESRGETLKQIARRGPTSVTVEQVYWHPENEPLRQAVAAEDAELAARLEVQRQAAGDVVMDKKALKARAEPYQAVPVSEGTPVALPQPAIWFIALAGAVAICAMILPGISGSYILLIFGVYFFILNSLKGMLGLLAQGQLPVGHIVYLGVFGISLIAGILSFARVLSYLLREHITITLGALVGLMLGCLRGVWPFQVVRGGAMANVWPGPATSQVGLVVGAAIAGFVLVAALTVVGSRAQSAEGGEVVGEG